MQVSTQWFVIRDWWQGFEFSRLNSLLLWAFSRQDKNLKVTGIINGSVTFKQMNVILTLWTVNNGNRVPFSCLDSLYVIHNQAT